MSDTYNGVKSENKGTMVTKNNRIQLLQAAVICLSLASLYTTAQGMNNYIFRNSWIAYITSGAIQGILLALSMNIPRFIQNIGNIRSEEHPKLYFFLRQFVRIAIILLTLVSLFCSSWFSYIYIADVVYGESWSADSELLVQQTYRDELYKANDYARTYQNYLEEDMGDKILQLEQQARQLKETEIEIGLDWNEERAQYVDTNNAASEYMRLVIDSMERASADNASQADRKNALDAISDAQGKLQDGMAYSESEREKIPGQLQESSAIFTTLNTQYGQATSDAARAAIQESMNSETERQRQLTERMSDLQEDYNAYSDANNRLSVYASKLDVTGNTSSQNIRSALLEMQTEFFNEEPDEKALINSATGIFTSLRNASTQIENQNANDASFYSSLLTQMNSLILNLKDYADAKEIAGALDTLISNLRRTGFVAAATSQVNGENDDEETNPSEETSNKWKDTWLENLQELKNLISGMPLYLERTTEGTSESAQTNEVIKMQQEILLDYDRSASSDALDDMIRRYVSNHNALDQGIIYLQSPRPYNDLARFSLRLALLLDLAGFVFGFVDLGSKEQEKENLQNENTQNSGESSTSDNDEYMRKELAGAWSVVPAKNSYVIMTGDYEYMDGIYLYHIFKNGLLESWRTKEKISPKVAIIQQCGKNFETGISIPADAQPIRFAQQTDTPQDGIYHHGSLSYEGGMIFWSSHDTKVDQKGSKLLLAGVDEYVPVYCFDAKSGINETLPVSDLKMNEINAETLVVALNPSGTEIVSIYIVKE